MPVIPAFGTLKQNCYRFKDRRERDRERQRETERIVLLCGLLLNPRMYE